MLLLTYQQWKRFHNYFRNIFYLLKKKKKKTKNGHYYAIVCLGGRGGTHLEMQDKQFARHQKVNLSMYVFSKVHYYIWLIDILNSFLMYMLNGVNI